MLTSLSTRLQQIDMSSATKSNLNGTSSALMSLSSDVLLNLLVTMVDLRSLSSFSCTSKFARHIISQTRILEVVAKREWYCLIGCSHGDLCRWKIGVHSYLQLKQWEHRLLYSHTYLATTHFISDSFLFDDGAPANIEELEGSMRIPSPNCFDASINFAITAHEDDIHVYIWALPSCTRVSRLQCEEPPCAVAMYNNRAVTLEKVPLLMIDSQYRLKLKLWVIPGSGLRQCACMRVLNPPADFPFQIMVTTESFAAVNFGAGGKTILVLSSWCCVGSTFIASYKCTMCHIFSADTGQLLAPPHIVAATYSINHYTESLDWRGFRSNGLFRSDDLRLLSCKVDARRVHVAAGISSYVTVSHIHGNLAEGTTGESLQGLWIQELSYKNHAKVFSAVALFDPNEFGHFAFASVKITEMHFIESEEYRAKHLLVLLDCGQLLEYDLRPQDDFSHMREFPADSNIWIKHQGSIVCMRVVGSTLLTLGVDYMMRSWDLFTGLSTRVVFPGIRDGFSPVGMQICNVGVVVASTNMQEDSINGDDFGACHLHVLDFTK